MLSFIKKHIRLITLSILGLGLILLTGFAAWLVQLNFQIEDGLKNKKFLPPTQYFSAPTYLFTRMNIDSLAFEDQLKKRNYLRKDSYEKIKNGEYFSGSNYDECRKIADVPTETKSCFLFMGKDSDDLEFKKIGFQFVAFNEKPILTLHGTPLSPSEFIALEPRLVAQYLGKEPIQQNYVPLGEMPVTCLNAVLAIEDAKFLDHSGVSVTGLARAIVKNLIGSRFRQGGSTITQQLVKNYFLTSERTFKRKFTELFMSLMLEAHSSKDEILETYLNIIYLGQNGPFQIRGFPAAAEYFFDKPIGSLDIHECALLAAVLNSPGLFDPFHKPENAKKRRNLVLDKMLEHEFASADEINVAKNQNLPVKKSINISESAPYYIDAAQKELASLSIPTDGMKIYMGLDLEAQASAQKSVFEQLAKLESESKSIKTIRESGKLLESALLSANNKTGLIQSIVGGRSYKLTQFNRAIDGHRQVGSIMKPFVYLAALESSTSMKPLTPVTILHDSKFTIEYQKQSWTPENYGKKYFGDIPMYFALKNSLNCATASLGLQIGLPKIISIAHAAGIESNLEEVPSLTLGAFELYPKEVLQSYSTLANLGLKKNLRTIRFVVNQSNDAVYTSSDSSEQVLPKEITSSLVSMMKQTIQGGTARQVVLQGFNHPAAGKTGTTSDNRDSWFGGYTPYLTTIVWVGYDDNTSEGLTGASGALPIWISYMKAIGSQYPADDFSWPDDVSKVEVSRSILAPNTLPENDQPANPELIFVKGQEPPALKINL
jgi:penicillin-binding protein 1B